MEILENIDLNKVLDELRMRDRKLKQLRSLEGNVNEKVEAVFKMGEERLHEMKRKYEKERGLKQEAFAKLDALRVEIRALEGREYTGDIWKDKCKELYELCRVLQRENEELKAAGFSGEAAPLEDHKEG